MLKSTAHCEAHTTNLCTDTGESKRSPLPFTATWNGRSGADFESCISKFRGHVNQQSSMGCLLHDGIGRLWLKCGSPEKVLMLGMQRKLHPHLQCVTAKQFVMDITWLHGAMQQSITGRGNSHVLRHEPTQDGLCCWKEFITAFRHDGSVKVFLQQQQQVLMVPFTLECKGGMLQFLEDCELAFDCIDNVTSQQSHHSGIWWTDWRWNVL